MLWTWGIYKNEMFWGLLSCCYKQLLKGGGGRNGGVGGGGGVEEVGEDRQC